MFNQQSRELEGLTPAYSQTANHRGEGADAGHKRQYEKRKVAGLCVYFGCEANPHNGRRYCRAHLVQMSARNKRRSAARKNLSLCVYCGTRPQFWGVRCVICRQRFAKDPLPFGARKALRLFRQAEKEFQLEQLQAEARFGIRKLIARGDIERDQARAWRLYAGLDNGRWRTYQEVGNAMRVSKERVRQLLYPAKATLNHMLGGKVPWKPLPAQAHNLPHQQSKNLNHSVLKSRSSLNVAVIIS